MSLLARRKSELERYERLGLPKRRTESWRWTDLKPLNDLTHRVAAAPWRAPDFGLGLKRISILDGVVKSHLSEAGLRIVPLAEGAPDLLDAHFGMPADSAEGLGALNVAKAADGLVVHAAGAVAHPVHLDFCASGTAAEIRARHLIVVEAGASLTLIETHSGARDAAYFNHQGFDIVLGEGARFNHYRLEQDGRAAIHLADLNLRLGAQAHYDSLFVSLGAALARNDVALTFGGAGAQAVLNAAYLALRKRHVDITSLIDHKSGNCRSEQVVKGVVGEGRGVFRGKIHVAPGADGTDGRQLTKALLLSDRGEVDHKPELEIFADDVKCAHGATIGDLDPASLFYLRARGIGEDEARMMLIRAFLAEALDGLSVEAVSRAFADRIDTALGEQA